MESLFWILLLCILPLVIGLFTVAAAALVFGVLTLIRSRKVTEPQRVRLQGFALLAIGALPFILLAAAIWRDAGPLVSEGFQIPQVVSGSSAEIAPMLEARRAAGAEELGFTLIEAAARVEIQRTVGESASHDVMLHIYGSTSRTVAFVQEGDTFRWVGEQEIFTGPNEYLSETSYQLETLAMTFDTVYLSGAPLNRLHFSYFGDDPRLDYDSNLTYEKVFPILLEWGVVTSVSP